VLTCSAIDSDFTDLYLQENLQDYHFNSPHRTINHISAQYDELLVTRRPEPDLADAVEAFALAELVLGLLGALLGLLQAAHGVGVLAVLEADVAQVVVGPVHVLPQLVLPLQKNK